MRGKKHPVLEFWFSITGLLASIIKPIVHPQLWDILKKLSPSRQVVYLLDLYLLKKWRSARKKASTVNNTSTKSPPGINLVGYLRSMTGLGEAARSSILALDTANIPYNLIEYDYGMSPNQDSELSFDGIKNRAFSYKVNLLHVNPPQMPHLFNKFGKDSLVGKYNIGVWYWEMPEFPDEWRLHFDVVDEVWVATEFVRDAVGKKASVPVIRIPPAIQVEYAENLTRTDFGLPEDLFLFLCSFDVHSVQNRKNPEAAIEAFKLAFKPKDKSVGLVIKINNSHDNQPGVDLLKSELREYINCFFIEETFSRKKFSALLKLTDVYVSLHRSEGFGLVPAEAMYLGKPVVLTNWSGVVDFANNSNSCGIKYKLVPVGQNIEQYSSDQYWANPDIEHAAEYFVKLYSDPEYYKKLSSAAAFTIREKYSPAVVGSLIKERLHETGYIY